MEKVVRAFDFGKVLLTTRDASVVDVVHEGALLGRFTQEESLTFLANCLQVLCLRVTVASHYGSFISEL